MTNESNNSVGFQPESPITFNNLPQAVSWLVKKLLEIEQQIATQYNTSASDDSNEVWMNVDDLRDYLPNHPAKSTIYVWASTHAIPFHKKGRYTLFRKSEIDEWLGNETCLVDNLTKQSAQYFLKSKQKKSER
jgi:excisionase family DNA binding protein